MNVSVEREIQPKPRAFIVYKKGERRVRAFFRLDPDVSVSAFRLRCLRFVLRVGFRDQGCELEMGLTLAGDDDGEWLVRFRLHKPPWRVFSPYFVGRQQW